VLHSFINSSSTDSQITGIPNDAKKAGPLGQVFVQWVFRRGRRIWEGFGFRAERFIRGSDEVVAVR